MSNAGNDTSDHEDDWQGTKPTWLPTWSKLSRLGNSRILRTSYLWLIAVPIAAKFLSAVEQTITIPLSDSSLTLTLALPFNWKVLYYGAVSLSIATVVYWWRCPELVRLHRHYAAFQSTGQTGMDINLAFYEISSRLPGRRRDRSIKNYLWQFVQVPKDDESELRERLRYAMKIIQKEIATPRGDHVLIRRDYDIEENQRLERNAFWYAWHCGDFVSPGWRVICLVFYTLGILASLWVIAEGLIYVTRWTLLAPGLT